MIMCAIHVRLDDQDPLTIDLQLKKISKKVLQPFSVN